MPREIANPLAAASATLIPVNDPGPTRQHRSDRLNPKPGLIEAVTGKGQHPGGVTMAGIMAGFSQHRGAVHDGGTGNSRARLKRQDGRGSCHG